MKKVALVIPCRNEEQGIAKVLTDIPHEQMKLHGFELEVIVVDNQSDDRTAFVAEELGATVVEENERGKGNAMMKGFRSLSEDVEFVVMLDGDNTYKASEMLRLLEPLTNDFADVIIGSRLGGKTKENAFKIQNRIANWGYTFLVRQFYQANVTDVLSGYFAWKRNALDTLTPHLKSDGFAIEMEMITKMVKLGFEIYSVPITYDQREGETKLNSISDGIGILRMFAKNLVWNHGRS